MREIKFRAWDKEVSRMSKTFGFSDGLIQWSDGDVGMPIAFAGHKAEQRDRFDFMQYTGLKDKNGVEIYEGDIIEWNGNIFPVTVDDFHGYRFNYGKDLFCRAYAEDGKVIGNLYEHPQLTEVK